MTLRRDRKPGLRDETVSPSDVLEHLQLWKAETLDTVASLRALGRLVEEKAAQLESPRAVSEFIDVFVDLFARAASDLERIIDELPQHVQRGHLDAMRQLASNAAAENRRLAIFRDKWINRPLPYEQVRPLLNQILNTVRGELEDYRDLSAAAARLDATASDGSKPDQPGSTLDRRDLFTRWFGR